MLNKLFALVRGGLNNAAEEVADRNAVTIMEQELRDSKSSLAKAQTELTKIIGQKKMSEQRYSEAEQQYLKYQQAGKQAEEARKQAAEAGNQAEEARNTELVGKLQSRLQTLDTEGTSLREEIEQYTALEARLKSAVTKTRDRINTIEREMRSVKATEAVQKAQESVMSNASGAFTGTNSAMASLDRIKARQAGKQAQLDAADELDEAMSGGDLDKELASAGFLEKKGAGFGSTPAISSSSFGQKQIGSTPSED